MQTTTAICNQFHKLISQADAAVQVQINKAVRTISANRFSGSQGNMQTAICGQKGQPDTLNKM